MPNIFYWDTVLTRETLPEEALIPLRKLLSGDTKGADLSLKKVKGARIYSIKTNAKGRLLLTTFEHLGQKQLLVLEYLPNHEYEKSRFMQPGILTKFLAMHMDNFDKVDLDKTTLSEKDFTECESEELTINLTPSAELNLLPAHYQNNQFIVFDNIQNQSLEAKAPLYIEGPPGSGKTSISFALLIQAVNNETGNRILYVTQSENLARSIEREWDSVPLDDKCKSKVSIHCYAELLTTQNFEDADSSFSAWFNKCGKRVKNSLAPFKRFLLKEFRLLSGASLEDYLNLDVIGQKQTLIPHDLDKQETRRILWEAYQDYLAHCGSSLPLEFYTLPKDMHGSYDLVIVDEGQDFSTNQLKQLALICKNQQLVGCFDFRQSLSDLLSKKEFMKRQLKGLTQIELSASYRCPRTVTKVLQKTIELRNESIPKQRAESHVSDAHDSLEEGRVIWLSPNSTDAEDHLRAHYNNADACIITSELHKQEAQKFGTQVFTPQDIKGLQFKVVFIYRLLDSEIWKTINQELAKTNFTPNADYATAFHELIVSVSRATNTLIFIQNDKRTGKILSKILPERKSETIPVTAIQSGKDEWVRRAIRLLNNNNIKEARQILKTHCEMDEDAITRYITSLGYSFNSNHIDLEVSRQSLADQTALIEAVKNGNKDTIQRLLVKGVDVNKQDEDGMSALLFAAKQGHAETVDLLLDHGADLLQRCTEGKVDADALMLAIRFRHIGVVKILLERGAPVDLVYKDGKTALFAASLTNDAAFLEALFEKGADIHQCDYDGKTAFYFAAGFEFLESVRVLLDHGADINTNLGDGITILMRAVFKENKDFVKVLLEKNADVNMKSNNGETALFKAVKKANSAIVKLLLVHGADVNVKSNNGYTPLMIAAYKENNIDIVNLLLTYDADVNKKTSDNISALWIACDQGNRDVARALLAKGAHVNHQDRKGNTPILRATQKGHTALVKILLENGADFNRVYPDSSTILSLAVMEGHIDIVRILLEKGAEVNRIIGDMQPILCVAILNKRMNIANVLLDCDGLNINEKDPSNHATALMLATEKGHKDIVRKLLDKGVDLNAQDSSGQTALFIASNRNRQELVRLLLQYGADVSIMLQHNEAPERVNSRKPVIIDLLANNPYDFDSLVPLCCDQPTKAHLKTLEETIKTSKEPRVLEKRIGSLLRNSDSNLLGTLIENKTLLPNDLFNNRSLIEHLMLLEKPISKNEKFRLLVRFSDEKHVSKALRILCMSVNLLKTEQNDFRTLVEILQKSKPKVISAFLEKTDDTLKRLQEPLKNVLDNIISGKPIITAFLNHKRPTGVEENSVNIQHQAAPAV